MSVALQEGSIFAGRYRVVRCIAMGGMGAVYEVVHLEAERPRALKVMLPHILESADHRARFAREAKVAASIKSEFIVDVVDAGLDDATGIPFLEMELLEGEELSVRLARLGTLPPDEVVIYLHQTALALHETHKASIVHRDLKPKNLFLTARPDGAPHIKVLDFGVAEIMANRAPDRTTKITFGTPLYMSPEQFVTDSGITPAADIFALGMIAYTLLVGRSYWTSDTTPGGSLVAFARIASDGPQEPASVRAAAEGVTLPEGFDGWFAKVTAFHPEDRFASALSAVSALAEVLELPPPAAPMPLAGAAKGRATARQRARRLLGAVALLSLVGSSIGLYLTRSRGLSPASSSLARAPGEAPSSAAPATRELPHVETALSTGIPLSVASAAAQETKPGPPATSSWAPASSTADPTRRPKK